MRLLPSRPGLPQFTQVLPLLDPDNDPSLKTRGAFPAKVRKQPCVGNERRFHHQPARCAARHVAPAAAAARAALPSYLSTSRACCCHPLPALLRRCLRPLSTWVCTPHPACWTFMRQVRLQPARPLPPACIPSSRQCLRLRSPGLTGDGCGTVAARRLPLPASAAARRPPAKRLSLVCALTPPTGCWPEVVYARFHHRRPSAQGAGLGGHHWAGEAISDGPGES